MILSPFHKNRSDFSNGSRFLIKMIVSRELLRLFYEHFETKTSHDKRSDALQLQVSDIRDSVANLMSFLTSRKLPTLDFLNPNRHVRRQSLLFV